MDLILYSHAIETFKVGYFEILKELMHIDRYEVRFQFLHQLILQAPKYEKQQTSKVPNPYYII